MSFSMNIHPDPNKDWTWESVSAEVFGKNGGDCVNLHLDNHTFSFHYGHSKNKNDFIVKLKEAINSLPCSCDTCGQEINKRKEKNDGEDF